MRYLGASFIFQGCSAFAGPTIRFHADATFALCGAAFEAKLDDKEVPFWKALAVKAGSILTVGAVSESTIPSAYSSLHPTF